MMNNSFKSKVSSQSFGMKNFSEEKLIELLEREYDRVYLEIQNGLISSIPTRIGKKKLMLKVTIGV